MDVINPEVVAVAAYNVCQQIQSDPTAIPSWTDVALVIGTASVENGFKLTGVGRGLGVFGISIDTAIGIYTSFKHEASWWWKFRKRQSKAKTLWGVFSKAWLGISNVPWIPLSKQDLRHLMVHDIRFAASMCRWIYLGYPGDDPENLTEVAEAWHLFFTLDEKNQSQNFLDAWTDNGCAELMDLVGYR